MDLFEHYYIVKLPTKYNKAYLQNGMTSIEIEDSTDIQFYSVKEFEKKYKLPNVSKGSRACPSIGETMKSAGYEIIEVESANVFDEKMLQYDLDRTIFKCDNVYLISRFLQRSKKRKTEIVHRTNRKLLELKNFLGNPFLTTNVNEENVMTYEAKYHDTSFDELEEKAIRLLDMNILYDVYTARKTRYGNERLVRQNICCYPFITRTRGRMVGAENGILCIEVNDCYLSQPGWWEVGKNEYRYNLKKISELYAKKNV